MALGATYFTSYDKGHRHTVTIPSPPRGRGGLGALGQWGSSARWYRVYDQNRFAGWAWANPGDAAMFSNACANVIRTQAQGGFWESLFTARNPSYRGASGWYQVWYRPTQGFVGWYDVGFYTAKAIAAACPQLDVFTSHGQAV